MNIKLEPIDLIDFLDFESDIEQNLYQTTRGLRVSQEDTGFDLVLGWVISYMVKNNQAFTIMNRLMSPQTDLESEILDAVECLKIDRVEVEVYQRNDMLILVVGIEHLNEFERVVEKIKIHSKKRKSGAEFDFNLVPTIRNSDHVGTFNAKDGTISLKPITMGLDV